MELKRVVVTGLGAITPVGNGVPEFWENIVNGVSGAGPITHFDASLFKTQFACEVKNFDVTKYIDRKEARKMDLYTQYAIAVAKEAVADSGLDVEKEDLNRIGVIFGAGIGGIHTFEEEVGNYYTRQEMGPKFNPFFIPKMISDIAAGQISIMYGFHGPNYATCSACATSTNAIADAFNLIRLGKANVIVSGGSEAAIFPAGVGGFNAMHALSTRNDEPEKASRPFSASRDGFIMGEGGGCLILEELEHAKARGAKIYAEVAGVGMSADAHHLTASHPEGLGAKLVMMNALEDAEMDPKEVDYINVHGTSTPVGDISEAKAIKEVFGDHAFELNISSTKSMTGHLLGAAGAVESIASILAIKNGIVPPTINHEEGDDDENIDYNLNFTFNKAQKREVNVPCPIHSDLAVTMRALSSRNTQSNIVLRNEIDKIRLLFRKDRESYLCFYRILGFYPRNIQLYEQALLHKSTSVRSDKGRPLNNERLEFLGDAILDAIVGDIVYKRFEGKREGFLTNTRSKIVQRETLNKLAVEIGLDKLIKYSTRSSSHNSYMYGNAFEAFIGAIYLDQGYERCKQFMEQRIINRYIDLDKISRKEVNFKSKLIEWSQKNKMEVSFELIEQFLDHDSNPVFQTEVRIEGLPAGTGTGYSKKESQQNAAQMAIKKVKEPTFMSTIEEIKIQHSATATEMETEMEVEFATDSEIELATGLENELETELNANPEIEPENVSEENILVDEISTVQDTEAPATNQNKSPCDDPESPNRDLQ